MRSNIVRYGLIRYFWQFWHVSEKIITRSCTVLFEDLRMFLAVILGFKNEIYGLHSVIYGYVRSYAIGAGYVRSYTITEGACPRSVIHLAKNEPYIYPYLYGRVYTV